jgi:putative flippase GtrA
MIKPRQFARFAVVGLVATAIHVNVGLVLAEDFGLAPFWVNLSAFAAAILASCFGNLA